MEQTSNHLRILITFLEAFDIENLRWDSVVMRASTSSESCYLVNRVPLPDCTTLETVIATLEQHQSLSDQHLLTLQHYSINPTRTITTVYQYGDVTLAQAISHRQDNQEYYSLPEIYSFLHQIISTLEYLASQGIGYGVLHAGHLFLN